MRILMSLLFVLGLCVSVFGQSIDNRITLTANIAPSTLPTTQMFGSNYVIVTITNTNQNSKQNIQTGDSFAITYDNTTFFAVELDSANLLSINSKTLSAANFRVSKTGQQVIVSYAGNTPALFAPGDSLSFKLKVVTAKVGGSNITFQQVAGNNKNYNILKQFLPVTIIDFPIAQDQTLFNFSSQNSLCFFAGRFTFPDLNFVTVLDRPRFLVVLGNVQARNQVGNATGFQARPLIFVNGQPLLMTGFQTINSPDNVTLQTNGSQMLPPGTYTISLGGEAQGAGSCFDGQMTVLLF